MPPKRPRNRYPGAPAGVYTKTELRRRLRDRLAELERQRRQVQRKLARLE